MGTGGETDAISEPTTPWPPRYRWLKRSIAIFVISLLLLSGLRLWWGWYAHRQLQAEIDAAHARGEPILTADFKIPDIPDSENAGAFLRHAATVANVNFDPLDESATPWRPSNVAQLERHVKENKTALDLVRQARQCPLAAWGVAARSPMWNLMLPDLNRQRGLCQLLIGAMQVDHLRGNDADAIETLRDMKRQADAVEMLSPPMPVTYLTAAVIDMTCSNQVLWLSRDLRIGNDTGAASVPQVRQLMAELGDEQKLSLGGRQCFWGEQALAIDELPAYANNRNSIVLSYFAAPMYELEALRIIRRLSVLSEAMGCANWPTANAKLTALPRDHSNGVAFLSHILSGMLLRTLNRTVVTHFRVLTMRRAAVIALAIALYRADHGGRWPARLSELIPRYLAAPPTDPFSIKGDSFCYNPEAISAGEPIIYSVGENGIDDGGSEERMHSPGATIISTREGTLDIVFHLTAPPPTSRPSDSPQAADHQRDKQHGQRNAGGNRDK